MQLASRKQLSKKNPWRLDDRNREYEIIYFCRQYKAWKRRLSDIVLKHGGNEWDDPTGEEAITRRICQEKIDLVEQTAMRVAGKDLYKYLLMSVTENIPYTNLRTYHGMNYPRDPFHELRHEFYYWIDKALY